MDLIKFSDDLAAEIGLPIAYHHFEIGKAPSLPFLIYYMSDEQTIEADDMDFYTVISMTVELYSDIKQPDIEQKISDFFASREILTSHVEEWIDEQKMYMQVYEFELGEQAY